MMANREATPAHRREAVADFATRLFGHAFTGQQVVEETLVTFTEGPAPCADELQAAMSASPPQRP
jgi:hypothetical protein